MAYTRKTELNLRSFCSKQKRPGGLVTLVRICFPLCHQDYAAMTVKKRRLPCWWYPKTLWGAPIDRCFCVSSAL